MWSALHLGGVPRDTGDSAQTFYRAAMESREPLALENRSAVASGRVFALRAYPSDEGLTVYGQDVTERTLAEEALRESEERFRTAFEHSPLGMGLGDPDGRVIGSNAMLEEMLGYGKDELRGMSYAEFTHPDDLAGELAAPRASDLGRGGPVRDREALRPQGRSGPVGPARRRARPGRGGGAPELDRDPRGRHRSPGDGGGTRRLERRARGAAPAARHDPGHPAVPRLPLGARRAPALGERAVRRRPGPSPARARRPLLAGPPGRGRGDRGGAARAGRHADGPGGRPGLARGSSCPAPAARRGARSRSSRSARRRCS